MTYFLLSMDVVAFCLIFGDNNCDTDVFSAIVPVVLEGEKKKEIDTE